MAFLNTSPLQQLDMRQLVDPEGAERGDVVSESATAFVVVYGDGRLGTYSGQFQVAGGEVLGGTANQYVESVNGADVLSLGGFGVSLFDFESALVGGGLDQLFRNQIFNGADTFEGSDFGDYLFGYGGNDIFEGNSGNDTIDGMGGIDTAKYDDPREDFKLTVNADGTVEVRDVDGDEGEDTLISVEQIAFSDEVFPLDQFAGIAGLEEAQIRIFVEMYIAYFDRAPDAPGLFYWGTRLADGMMLNEIARSFFDQDETRALYPDPGDNEGLVKAVYQNVLEREPDPAGEAYWIEQLEMGMVDRGEFILAIIDGAKKFAAPDATPEQIEQAEADVRTITDKADIGVYYAVIQGLDDPFGEAREAMDIYSVEDRDASLASAKAEIDAFAADASTDFTLQLMGVLDDPFAAAG
ncbi:MAG: DUF4214 domain-containing protein [Pseudomonadota bacterium]